MNGEDASQPSVVPESLLALAKDSRYHHEFQTLLTDLLGSYGLAESRIQWLSTLISSLLSTMVVIRTGRTLGMHATGLQFSHDARWRVILSSVVSAAMIFAIQTLAHPESSEDTGSTETLRGEARRRIFEQQRIAMLNRSSDNASPPSLGLPNAKARAARRPMSRNQFYLLSRRAARWIAALLSQSTSMEIMGPHEIVVQPLPIRLSLVQWLLQLHLAMFLLNGRYPTLFHRFWRLRMNQKSDQLYTRPAQTSMIGVLLLVQAAGTAVPALARQIFALVAKKNRRLRIPQLTGTPPATTNRAMAEGLSSPVVPCAICRQPRVHPACPPCGHVGCWKCLLRWIQAHHECPFCRAPCEARDVIALYEYQPTHRSNQ